MNETPTRLGLKIDVDTLIGYRQGVPRLLRQLAQEGAVATFCFAIGPDRSGLAIRRVFTQRGFLGKMLRNKALTTYGLPTVLYGTALPAPPIIASDPGIVREVVAAGHEICVHGWDHVSWHDGLKNMSQRQVEEQMQRAFDGLEQAAGRQPDCFAAPGWQCATTSLAAHDARGLRFASDVRGEGGPFLPQLGDQVFQTPQVPTTLPTLDELWGREVQEGAAAASYWARLLKPAINVLTIHAEVEGMALPDALPEFLQRAREGGFIPCSLGRIVSEALKFSVRPIGPQHLPGRAGTVWCVHH